VAFDWLSGAIILPELHAAIGAAVVFGSYLLLADLRPPTARAGRRPPWGWNRVAIGVFVAVDLLKELLWDPTHEADNPFLWQGVTDLAWYGVGIVLALALIYARFRRL
jgi:hypothetical protein